ncbi:PREDICTED: coiled-coil domain-containing protein 42B-like [Nanorana parkeri]|uniref:coiled-coil domain-containing protein 42B-like n=1 Tax=Nanorana parkeri TaxID=125878 RepID=UPI0008540E26|nr:PREDICTED: coiled-coil domain-containing protein 42B-like [Nanorana parkeri]
MSSHQQRFHQARQTGFFAVRAVNRPPQDIYTAAPCMLQDDVDEDITQIPIIKEAAGKILDTSKNTLQKTLVLKKEVEYDRVSQELVRKRQEFSQRMQELEAQREELTLREKECADKAAKFEKFLKDSEAKQRRATVRYQAESRQNDLRKAEIHQLAERLEEKRVRQQNLHERMKRNKIYEEFLLKMVEKVPDNYLEYGMDSPVKAIIRRYETLSFTNGNLVNNLTVLADEHEVAQYNLEALKRKHDTSKLTMTSELSQLQLDYDRLRERNKQLELTFNVEKSQFRNQSVEIGSLLLAVINLADQCHMKHYGPLSEVDLAEKLDMVKEYILEKIQVERLAKKPYEELQALSNPEEYLRRQKKKTANKEPQRKKGANKVVAVQN